MVPAKTQDFQRRQDSKTGNSVLSPAGHDAPMTTFKADEADEIEIAEITSMTSWLALPAMNLMTPNKTVS